MTEFPLGQQMAIWAFEKQFPEIIDLLTMQSYLQTHMAQSFPVPFQAHVERAELREEELIFFLLNQFKPICV